MKTQKEKVTKAKVEEVARYYGCTVHYSGNGDNSVNKKGEPTETNNGGKPIMYIKGDHHAEAIIAIKALDPPFEIRD